MILPKNITPEDGSQEKTATWRRDLFWLTLILLAWFGLFLGSRPLSNPDEGRYTEIPREMAASNDYVTPRLNGVKYFEKPPLQYWLTALAIEIGGVNEWTARFWTAALAVLGGLSTYAAARALFGRAAGWWAAIVLSTMLMYYVLSRVVILDMAVAVFIAGALFAFLAGIRLPAGAKRRWLFWAFYASMALAVLSKGLIGFVLPCTVAFVWLLVFNQWKRLRPCHPFTGALVLLVIAAPWHILASRANHDFAQFYFVHEHWERFTTTVHLREAPWWFFAPVLIAGIFPWTVFIVQTLRATLSNGAPTNGARAFLPAGSTTGARTFESAGSTNGARTFLSASSWRTIIRTPALADTWFLIVWAVVIFLFFSKSQSKLPPYILPIFPALAVLLGKWLADAWHVRNAPGLRAGLIVFAVIAAVLGVAVCIYPVPAKNMMLGANLLPWRIGLALVLIGSAAAICWNLARGSTRNALVAMTAGFAVFLISVNLLGGMFDTRSTKPLDLVLRQQLAATDTVYSVGEYFQDIAPYLQREVCVVDYVGELEFGVKSEPEKTASRFINKEEFLRRWNTGPRAYAIVQKRHADGYFVANSHTVLGETSRYVLLVNKPAAK